jgi:hypothetical protein
MASDIRASLHSVYALIRGVESNKSIAAITLDHLIEEQIQSIEGGSSRYLLNAAGDITNDLRPSKLDELTRIQESIDQLVAAIEKAGDDPEILATLGLVSNSNGGTE